MPRREPPRLTPAEGAPAATAAATAAGGPASRPPPPAAVAFAGVGARIPPPSTTLPPSRFEALLDDPADSQPDDGLDGAAPRAAVGVRGLLQRAGLVAVLGALALAAGGYVLYQRDTALALEGVSRMLPGQALEAGITPGAACGALEGEELRRCLRETCTAPEQADHPLCVRAKAVAAAASAPVAAPPASPASR
ncbi:hypothetical protein [Aquabacterium sp. J223]|uniref:hypothetical protein n=1 Tax=Aquabacterium sp. J223 TaxID=2898431 RepID=UPI0021ADAF7E|nr:hypothetical protein [Aquabacterium sp. J223]UUX93956.1 hypothetical protein LRS07_11340 [Aquabacterium sp. J223]